MDYEEEVRRRLLTTLCQEDGKRVPGGPTARPFAYNMR
jgi:hypothetical protein